MNNEYLEYNANSLGKGGSFKALPFMSRDILPQDRFLAALSDQYSSISTKQLDAPLPTRPIASAHRPTVPIEAGL
jgi:hypothetical protein